MVLSERNFINIENILVGCSFSFEEALIREGEIPVFWACGVTPQAAIENARLPLVITHAPGHMFITNVPNKDLNDYLESRKTK